jgi:hypothetical protein
MNKKMSKLTMFLNKSAERRFNDGLVQTMAVEIKLRSGGINEHMILPTYYKREFYDQGEYLPYDAPVRMVMPKAALAEAQEIVAEGSRLNLSGWVEIRMWLQQRLPELKAGCLAPINALGGL